MSYYLKTGEILWPTEGGKYDVRKSLPTGTYAVGLDAEKGWYLKPITSFKITGKIYGKTNNHAQRIMNTFHSRPNSTGVLLNGEKGSGKTMLAKMLSEKAEAEGISTLVINTPYCGDSFNTFIQSIDEKCIILFDEFEKVFDEDDQESILTLLDGVYPSKKLFVLTVNDKYSINSHMRNRPGRLFYMLDYKGLDAAFIEEYCMDVLENKEYIPQIIRISLLFDSFNFDMLKALVEEMNRYDESPAQSLEMLNAKPNDGSTAVYDITCTMNGKKLTKCWPDHIRGNPITHDSVSFSANLSYQVSTTGVTENDITNLLEEDDECINFDITPSDLKNIDPVKGTFTYIANADKANPIVVVFSRKNTTATFNWTDAF